MALCSVIQEVNFQKQLHHDMKGDKVEINIHANKSKHYQMSKKSYLSSKI